MEVEEIAKSSRDMGMWQIHALRSVLRMTLRSVYPIGRGHNVRSYLNRTVPSIRYQHPGQNLIKISK
jgi:hypothetical protein